MNNLYTLTRLMRVDHLTGSEKAKRFVRLLALFLLVTGRTSAAQAQLFEFGTSIQSMSNSENPGEQALAAELNSLAYSELPTALLNEGQLTLPGDSQAAVCLQVSADEIGLIDFGGADLADIQMVRVRVENAADLTGSYSADLIPSGVHILVISETEITPSALAAFFGKSLNRPVYYTISIPR
jgi:hypothetical protein